MRTIKPGPLETAMMFGSTIRWDSDILGLMGFIHSDGAVELLCTFPEYRLYLPSPAADIIRDITIRQRCR